MPRPRRSPPPPLERKLRRLLAEARRMIHHNDELLAPLMRARRQRRAAAERRPPRRRPSLGELVEQCRQQCALARQLASESLRMRAAAMEARANFQDRRAHGG